MPFPAAMELFDYWREWPPAHIAIQQLMGGMGFQHKAATQTLNDAETRIMASSPKLPIDQLPPHVKEFFARINHA